MSKKQIWLVIGIMATIVVFIVVGSYFFHSYQNGNLNSEDFSNSKTSFSSPSSNGNMQESTGKSSSTNQVLTSDHTTEKKQQMVYHADIQIQVNQLQTAKKQLDHIAKQTSASMVSSSNSEKADERYIRVTYNVPQNQFETFLEHSKKISDIPPDIQIAGEDVSEELVDLQSRIKAKRAMEARLIAMMDKATTTSDLLDIENTLGNVQEQLEQLTGRQKYLQHRVAFSTITVEITSSTYQPLQTQYSFINQASKEFLDSCINMWIGLQLFAIWLAQALPYLILIGIISLVAILVLRKKRKS
ncbi:DUF4349 domain-containing protein [Shimazuella alba]|uniref:DUF4349 domain-containing protein n=1 Tax=Shimazuella alba TaxID=2690964 RepID=A0A6I4VYC4_9BACL|nr:DUF4349 domain-containing protein [Shimazuella alba]MXQ55498.1 DUF4349 domain-containing protein [Shimazuella alba]